MKQIYILDSQQENNKNKMRKSKAIMLIVPASR